MHEWSSKQRTFVPFYDIDNQVIYIVSNDICVVKYNKQYSTENNPYTELLLKNHESVIVQGTVDDTVDALTNCNYKLPDYNHMEKGLE